MTQQDYRLGLIRSSLSFI